MIGVVSRGSDAWAVREFFELFKTPWEFYLPNKQYHLVIIAGEEVPPEVTGNALIIYSARVSNVDRTLRINSLHANVDRRIIEWEGGKFPIYGELTAFESIGRSVVSVEQTNEVVGSLFLDANPAIVRVGFDLFREVAFLLTQGQPRENARFATLEMQISLLRRFMVMLSVPFIEVPPVPAGYEFAACLTHDVDFVGIRDHKLDHTMWGFLLRATVGSLFKALTGRLPWSKCLRNCVAALSLPLVYLGLLKDFWLEFDRYMDLEKGLGSTFFFLPLKNVPGKVGAAAAPKRRAAKYELSEIGEHIQRLLRHRCEIGLHGIDAWQDVDSAKSELSRIREVTGESEIGTRMHWLYWCEDSPETLDRAGFTYDSTFGYNDAIGFRGGTTQPFFPRNSERLLEIPLNIQDSAMFYSDRMMLSETEALNACKDVIESIARSGGVLTVNWHTRSLSPERLWEEFYCALLREIKRHNVWFTTMREIAAWYRRRRALRFLVVDFEESGARVVLDCPDGSTELPFSLRLHHPRSGERKSTFAINVQGIKNMSCVREEVVEIRY